MSPDPVMYSFVNRGLEMSEGKAIAQGEHAAVEAFRMMDKDSNLYRLWLKGLHYKKIVLLGRDEPHMHNILLYLSEREIPCVPILDEGMTEVDTHVFTAIGVPLVDKNVPEIKAIFSTFELYKPLPPAPKKRPWWSLPTNEENEKMAELLGGY